MSYFTSFFIGCPIRTILHLFLDEKAKALLFIAEYKEVFYNTHTPRLGLPAYQRQAKKTEQGNLETRALPSPEPKHRTQPPQTDKVQEKQSPAQLLTDNKIKLRPRNNRTPLKHYSEEQTNNQ
jgi:hypothetical protein